MQTSSQSKNIEIKNGNKFQTFMEFFYNLFKRDSSTGRANPLYIPEITDHMFQFLRLSDIKNCRLVSVKWNQLAEFFLKTLSVVKIAKPERFEEFNRMFPDAQQCQIFTCFRFDGFKLPLCKFVSFCGKWYHNMSEITLYEVDFGMGKENEIYNLSPLLPSTLAKLRIQYCSPTIIISIDKICSIRVLELEKCVLNIIPGIVLNPMEIDLNRITILDGKENIEKLLINRLLNLDVLKKASFSGENLLLDLQGSHSMDHLSLEEGVKLLNWETSNWEINKFHLGVQTCEELKDEMSKSQIKYKELEISLTHLNVSLLPEGIEKLQVYLYNDGEVPPRISGEHNFPDLKRLCITVEEGNDSAPFLDIFTHCPKLSNLIVSCFPLSGEIILKTSSLPPKVKTLCVASGVKIILDRSLQLDSLCIYNAHNIEQYKNFVNIVKESHVKHFRWQESNLVDGNIFDNEKGNIVKSLIALKLNSFSLGEFPIVNNSEFEKSFLFPLVEEQGEDYFFIRGQKGIPI